MLKCTLSSRIYRYNVHAIRKASLYTQLQKTPISHFLGELWKIEVRNENTFIPYSLTISSESTHWIM